MSRLAYGSAGAEVVGGEYGCVGCDWGGGGGKWGPDEAEGEGAYDC